MVPVRAIELSPRRRVKFDCGRSSSGLTVTVRSLGDFGQTLRRPRIWPGIFGPSLIENPFVGLAGKRFERIRIQLTQAYADSAGEVEFIQESGDLTVFESGSYPGVES